MKLGLMTDIHEQVEHLRTALDRFRTEGTEQIVVIGDVFEMGQRIEETCRLLAEAKAIGVWGNHDFGLCFEPDDSTRLKYRPAVIEFMTSLRPRLDIAGCHFTHVEPWLDPEVLMDLWYFEGPPDEHRKLERIFNAVPNRIMFAGPSARLRWRSDRPRPRQSRSCLSRPTFGAGGSCAMRVGQPRTKHSARPSEAREQVVLRRVSVLH
jgi:hypothetical protein